MNPSGRDFGVWFLSRKRYLLPSFLAMLCTLLTGCPHNDYTVELKPESNGVERTLIFHRADGSGSNGVPKYETFPSNELAAITAVYPAGAVTQDGQQYVAKGTFSGAMPRDVGGAGAYTNLTTSLGNAGFYVERFRGNDDLAGQAEKRFQAADQMTDLLIGWTRTQFGRERGYKKLRKFLDEDFRNDLKNAGLYFWVGQISSLSDTNAVAEFTIRFGQYLHERGYLKLANVPELYAAVEDNNGSAILKLVQRFVAEKMEIPAAEPLPESFAVLDNPAAFEQSWTNYLARSDLYRAKVEEWKRKMKTDPNLKPPQPDDVDSDLFENLLEPFNLFGGETDHLTVKLALNHPPNHSNGNWQDGQVVWSNDLDPTRPLPILCYASWSDPHTEFQEQHFGKVILDGDELTEYCLWQSGLDGKQASGWESFLAGLQPEEKIREKLEAFRFTTESASATTNQPNIGCKLLMDAFPKDADASPAGSK